MSERDFDQFLLEALDEGLSSIGESSKQAIYFHLEKGFGIEREDIPDRIEGFSHAVERIFGLGANFLEILIMKRLYEKVGGCFKWPRTQDFTFAEYVAAAKRDFLERKQIKKDYGRE